MVVTLKTTYTADSSKWLPASIWVNLTRRYVKVERPNICLLNGCSWKLSLASGVGEKTWFTDATLTSMQSHINWREQAAWSWSGWRRTARNHGRHATHKWELYSPTCANVRAITCSIALTIFVPAEVSRLDGGARTVFVCLFITFRLRQCIDTTQASASDKAFQRRAFIGRMQRLHGIDMMTQGNAQKFHYGIFPKLTNTAHSPYVGNGAF